MLLEWSERKAGSQGKIVSCDISKRGIIVLGKVCQPSQRAAIQGGGNSLQLFTKLQFIPGTTGPEQNKTPFSPLQALQSGRKPVWYRHTKAQLWNETAW